MARIRSIKPDFWASEQVMDCSTTARLLFIGLWNFCDDAGNHSLNLRTIKAEIFPGDEIESSTIRRLLAELYENGLLAFYTSENKDFLHVTGWHHQKIEKPTMKHPPFSGQIFKDSRRLFDDSSATEGIVEEWIEEDRKEISPTAHESPNLNGHDLLGELPSKGKTDEVKAVVDAYHATLPRCQRITVLNEKRRKRVLAVVKIAKGLCKSKGWGYDGAQFFTAFFEECAKDPWMRGDVANPRNPAWKQNLDVLLAEDRFAKVLDAAFDGQGEGA